MDSKTLEALEGSIAKWQSIVDGTGADRLADNCSLCKAFPGCEGCPVAEATETSDCDNTPWVDWYGAQWALKRLHGKGEWRADTPELKELAYAELDFLKSLRPPSAVNPSVGE